MMGISMFIALSSLLSCDEIVSRILSISKLPKFMVRSSGERGVSGVMDLGDKPEKGETLGWRTEGCGIWCKVRVVMVMTFC